MWSEPKKTFSSYLKQKLRHQGAGKMYRKEHKLMLGLQAGSAIFFYITLFILILMQAQWWFLLALYLIRIVSQGFTYFPVFRKLKCPDLFWWFPVFDFICYFYMLALSIITLFKKNTEWK
jgi:hypothetical protein